MSKDRVAEVDTDFEHTGREAVIEFIKQKYNPAHVCHIITFGTEAARMVIKDVGRVLGYPVAYCNALAKKIPEEPHMTIAKALKESPEFKSNYENDPDAKKLIDLAMKLEGCKRHASAHACFDADTMITTKTGLKKIIDVQVGDEVLTHKGRYKSVVDTIVTETNEVHKLCCYCVPPIEVTGNHPLFTRKKTVVQNNRTGTIDQAMTLPEWVAVESINVGDWVALPLDKTDNAQILYNKIPYKTAIEKRVPALDATAFYEDGYIWARVRSHEIDEIHKKMYNLTVLDDSSYTANGIAAHNCGLVISPSTISDFLPTVMAKNDETGEIDVTTQVVAPEVEELSLLKMDLLGLKNLTVIHESIDAINNKYHLNLDYHDIPLDDRKTLQFLAKGLTGGVFQLESPGMTKVVTRMLADVDELPDSELHQGFERMIAAVALYRPGPMAFIDDYIEGMRNPASIHYDCPELESILKSTYGQIVYQEQVMQTVQKLAGYTLGRADLIRKAMGGDRLFPYTRLS